MPEAPQKILVVSLAGIGDTLFATPLIRELAVRFPKAAIDAFVLWKGAADVLHGNPHVKTVFQKDLMRAGRLEAMSYLGGLRRRRYDLSINTFPQSRIEYRVIARIIGAGTRLSHDYAHFKWLDSWLVTDRAPQNYSRHCVENNLALLGLLGMEPAHAGGGYELFLSPAEHEWANAYIEQHQLKGRTLLGLHVGSGGTKNLALRRWPAQNFAALLQRLGAERPDVSCLLFGGPEERDVHAFLMGSRPGLHTHVVDARTLREAAALTAKCQSFLSVDTALMHVAAAMRVPHQLVIETPTWNKTVEPFSHPFKLVKNPAVHGRNLDYYRYDGKGIRGTEEELRKIMEAVRVEDVFQAVTEALGSC